MLVFGGMVLINQVLLKLLEQIAGKMMVEKDLGDDFTKGHFTT